MCAVVFVVLVAFSHFCMYKKDDSPSCHSGKQPPFPLELSFFALTVSLVSYVPFSARGLILDAGRRTNR